LLLMVPGAALAAEDYVGGKVCASCHRQAYQSWQGSSHDLAMQEAGPDTVLGDFSGVEFQASGVTSRFYKQEGRFMVRTDGPDGELHDYPVAYTFGVYPLQQYLIAFPGGRLQALDIAWDSRKSEAGGQRWFALHPGETIKADDVLHWTGPNLNWNYMCADCHSTDLRKNYQAKSDSYDTRWSEIDVSCEACHGPGKAHVAWAGIEGERPALENKGLTARLDERNGVAWPLDPQNGKPVRSSPRNTSHEIQVCARCHSRRGQLTDHWAPGQPFMDGYRPALLDQGLYYPDGQIEDEVYVWGSFLQSRMYQSGVTCSDCHDPHAADLKAPGDAVCAQCHTPDRYATPAHHFHTQKSAGASCVECHMPATDYMQVDARHDHSMRIPRPDLSVRLGTPNACNTCHADKTPMWAAQQVEGWYGKQPLGLQRYAAALQQARLGTPAAAPLLQSLVEEEGQPAIARATALSVLGSYPGARSAGLIQAQLASEDPLLRMAALNALGGAGQQQLAPAFRLLWDDVRSVRIAAARLLAPLSRQMQLPQRLQQQLDKGVEEYIQVQRFNGERPESQASLGGLYASLGQYTQAETNYRKALRLQPHYVPAYINMAQLLSNRNREQEAFGLLNAGRKRVPDNADLEHATGLSLVRQKKLEPALEYLAKAAKLAPELPRYSYVYGVALNTAGQVERSLQVLEAAHQHSPANADILLALVNYNKAAGHLDAARAYGRKLQQLFPGNSQIEKLLQDLAPAAS